MMTLKSVRLLFCVGVAAALALPALAQTNIAFVDTQTAILNTAEIAKEQAAMEAKFKPQEDELKTLTDELQKIQSDLTTLQGKLTPQAIQDMNIRGQRLQRDIQRKTEDLNLALETHRNEVLQRVADRMKVVIDAMAEEKGLDAVLDASNAIYVKPALDLTAEATAAYDKAHPAQ